MVIAVKPKIVIKNYGSLIEAHLNKRNYSWYDKYLVRMNRFVSILSLEVSDPCRYVKDNVWANH